MVEDKAVTILKRIKTSDANVKQPDANDVNSV